MIVKESPLSHLNKNNNPKRISVIRKGKKTRIKVVSLTGRDLRRVIKRELKNK